jgi:NitT/TauT family transport system ATP-binding protein
MICNFWSRPRRLTSANAFVRLSHVSRRFDSGVTALENISLALARGKITAVIGASGSGKTTLLRMIAGLDQPSSGTIAFTATPKLAYVFQQPALLPWATVAENVALPAQLRHSSNISTEMLAHVGLSDKSQALPHQLSGGQQMRVSIARALASHPDVILLDEPFAALDEITRQSLCALVLRLSQQLNLSMVFVTHNISEAVYVADEVVLLGNHPGKAAGQMTIDAPTPRHADFRQTESYTRQCAALSAQLAQVMA